MELNNPPKFIGIVIVLVGLFALIALGRITWEQGLPIITLITGYLVGNGVAARKGDIVEPIISRRWDPPKP